MSKVKPTSEHIEKRQNVEEDFDTMKRSIISDAKQATEQEHKMTLMQAVRLYPKAAMWSILISTSLVMEGYDTAVSRPKICISFS
jgi:SP family general alpha glucoside:H+ symporter-like MFS transporter